LSGAAILSLSSSLGGGDAAAEYAAHEVGGAVAKCVVHCHETWDLRISVP
jgi:hypothetical protein